MESRLKPVVPDIQSRNVRFMRPTISTRTLVNKVGAQKTPDYVHAESDQGRRSSRMFELTKP